MFDTGLADVESLPTTDDNMVIVSVGGWARVEAAAAARRLAALAEFVRRRANGPTDCAYWSCDNWDAIAAEVAAVQGISHGVASRQMYLSVALHDRLPRVADLFLDGMLGARLVTTIVWRTDLIKDEEALALVDKTLASEAIRFGPMSIRKAEEAIDAIVDHYDPGALRRIRAAARGREIVVDATNAEAGTANLWGTLYAADAAMLDRRLVQMAHQVCDDDPRTIAQRRADALGALAASVDRLACSCGRSDCSAATDSKDEQRSIVIHVVADAAALEAPRDPALSGDSLAPEPDTRAPAAPQTTNDRRLQIPSQDKSSPALILGGGVIPTPLLAELVRAGAKVRPVHHPGDTVPEPSYRPSANLDAFVRCRDLTCRFPGCDRSAEFCDIDHTVPYPFGPTHPSNLKCLCRKHHLLKTFWADWSDRQLADGRVIWTSPTGQTYTTRPGSSLLFPTLSLPTGELPTPAMPPCPSKYRGQMMPLRRRTRAQDRARRIDAERALNDVHVAEHNWPPPF